MILDQSQYLNQLMKDKQQQKQTKQIQELQEEHNRYLNERYYYGVQETQETQVARYSGLREIKMTDEETWFLVFDINQILKLHIPKNEKQRDEFNFLRSLKRQIVKDNRISKKQIKWYEDIKEKTT